MLVHICDNKGCYIILEKDNRNIIMINGKEYELCNECMSKVNKALNLSTKSGYDRKDTDSVKNKKPIENIINKPVSKGAGKAEKKIEDYGGIEKIKKEYLEKNVTAKELAAKIGVSVGTIANYLKKNNVVKGRGNKKQDKKTKEDD